MKQTVTNACATQAILSILFNTFGLEENSEFKNLKEFALGLDYQTRGEIIGQSEFIRKSHNSFAKQEPFIYDGSNYSEKEAVYHFVAFIHKEGSIVELDGTKAGTIYYRVN